MTKKLNRIVVLAVTVFLLASCNDWPPDKLTLMGHFEIRRDLYAELEDKLRVSDYESVSSYLGDTQSIHVRLIGEESLVVVEDSDGWRELLKESSTLRVDLKDEEFRALVTLDHDGTNRITAAVYSHGHNYLGRFPKCQSEHESVRCGLCSVDLGDQWGLAYEWWPALMLPEESKKNQAGELSNADYLVLYEAAEASCWEHGSKKMGFMYPLD